SRTIAGFGLSQNPPQEARRLQAGEECGAALGPSRRHSALIDIIRQSCYTVYMKQTLLVKLAPEPEYHAALLRTLETFNAACNAIAEVAYDHREANKLALQRLVYYDVRERFGLSS